jgi:RNA recognition motif-containing protein
MTKKLYVGNLSYNMTEDELHSLFSEVGEVSSVAIIIDRMSGKSKGFGFVEMSSEAEAQTAIQELNGREVNNRSIRVSEAHAPRERSGGGEGREGRGGFSRGGGGGKNRGGPPRGGNRPDRDRY